MREAYFEPLNDFPNQAAHLPRESASRGNQPPRGGRQTKEIIARNTGPA
jgi:hypothetical protein